MVQATAEDREKGRLQRIENQEWAKQNLRQDWADANYWRTLSKHYNLRLAPWYKPATQVKYLNKALKAVNKDKEWWELQVGSHKDFVKLNPTMPAWVVQGIVMEIAAFEEGYHE